MFDHLVSRLVEYKSNNFVQHSIDLFMREFSQVTCIKIEPPQSRIKLNASQPTSQDDNQTYQQETLRVPE